MLGLGFAADEQELGAEFAIDRLAGQFAQADLGAGQIGQRGDGLLELPAHFADRGQHVGVLVATGVGHIQAKHIGAGPDEFGQLFAAAAGGANGGDDLRARAFEVGVVCHAI